MILGKDNDSGNVDFLEVDSENPVSVKKHVVFYYVQKLRTLTMSFSLTS